MSIPAVTVFLFALAIVLLAFVVAFLAVALLSRERKNQWLIAILKNILRRWWV